MNPDFQKWACAVIDGVQGRNSIGNINIYLDLTVALKQAYEQGVKKGISEGKEQFKKELQRQVEALIEIKSSQLK